MTLASREKWILAIGGLAAAVIVVGGHFALPLARRWSQMGDRLEPKLEYVGKLRDRVQGRDSLLARRDALARQMGSLCGPESAAAGGPSDAPTPETPESKGEGDAKPPENAEAQTADTDVPDDAPAAPNPADSTVAQTEETPGSDAPEPAPGDEVEGQGAEGQAEPPGAEEAPAPEKDETADGDASPAGRSSSGSVGLATHLERVAQQSGVKIKRISPRKRPADRKAGKHFTPVVLQLSIESDIQGLLKTLHALEKGDRFVRVEQLQLRRDLEGDTTIDASLDVMGYEAVARHP